MEVPITMNQTEHLETESNETPDSPDSISLSEILDQLKFSYPAYFRAWKSMITSYGVDEVITEWRGTAGLAQFIADTSTLDNSPTALPNVSVKLKRKLSAFNFSPNNVYWKIPGAAASKAARKQKLTQSWDKVVQSVIPSPHGQPGQLNSIAETVSSIEAIKQLYPTKESQEERMNTLFTLSMESTLTPAQDAELTVLGSLVAGTELEPEVTPSKYVDI